MGIEVRLVGTVGGTGLGGVRQRHSILASIGFPVHTCPAPACFHNGCLERERSS